MRQISSDVDGIAGVVGASCKWGCEGAVYGVETDWVGVRWCKECVGPSNEAVTLPAVRAEVKGPE